jgi:hypothetical protein
LLQRFAAKQYCRQYFRVHRHQVAAELDEATWPKVDGSRWVPAGPCQCQSRFHLSPRYEPPSG